jgi:hypothetical protein
MEYDEKLQKLKRNIRQKPQKRPKKAKTKTKNKTRKYKNDGNVVKKRLKRWNLGAC